MPDIARPDLSAGIAEAFVAAHLDATALDAFPGRLPEALSMAYAIQSEAITLWPDQIAGWKVAKIAPALAATYGVDRWMGPIFRADIARAGADTMPFPIIAGGGGALEGEIMLVLGKDAPPRKAHWTATAARELVAGVHIGIEIAGNAFAGNSALGPIAMICGLGNSLGLIIGPQIADASEEDILCTVTIDGEIAGEKSVDAGLNGPYGALAFALDAAASRGFPLRAGQVISTGAITGPHAFAIGQRGRADFGRFGRIDCHAVAATAVRGRNRPEDCGDVRHRYE